MKKITFCLHLFVCFAIVVANQVSYSSDFPVYECYAASSLYSVVGTGVEEEIARVDNSIENLRLLLYCFKSFPDPKKNKTLCLCRLYHSESTSSTEKHPGNLENSIQIDQNSSFYHYNHLLRLTTMIWMFFYLIILSYAYQVLMKYRSHDLSIKSLNQRSDSGSFSDPVRDSSSLSEEEWSEPNLGGGLGKLYTYPILPSNFSPTSTNVELESRANREYIFIRRPFHRPIVEEWFKTQSPLSFESKDHSVLTSNNHKPIYENQRNFIYEQQCGYSGFLINLQRSEVFLEGIPGSDWEMPRKYWASMHNIGEHINPNHGGWRRSLPHICAKWCNNGKPGYLLLPNPTIEKQKGNVQEQNSCSHESDDNLESLSVVCLRRLYKRYQRRKAVKARGKAFSDITSSGWDSSDVDSHSRPSTFFSTCSSSSDFDTSDLETKSFSLESLPKHSTTQSNENRIWRLYRYPIPPSVTSSSPQREQLLQAEREYLFIQRPYPIPLVNKWLEEITLSLQTGNESFKDNTCGCLCYLINTARTDVILHGIPGFRHEFKTKNWVSMHQIDENSRRCSDGAHGSLPNIFDELGFKHKSDFNEYTVKLFEMKAKEVHAEEERQSCPFDCEENLESISAVFYRQMREDEARREAAKGKRKGGKTFDREQRKYRKSTEMRDNLENFVE